MTKANRFDLLRLLFASTVFVYHAIVLSSFAPDSGLENGLALCAELSIQGFFVISGALVFGSLLNADGLKDYFNKRVRRLYPAYFVIIIIPAFISLIMTGQMDGVLRYLLANLSFLNFFEPNLPGLFEGQRFSAVNGALWTLKIEVMFYMVLPVLAWMLAKGKSFKWVLLGAIYIAAELWRAQLPNLDVPLAERIARQLPGQMSFFAAGIVLWMYREKAQKHASPLFLVGLSFLAISYAPNLEFIRAIGLAFTVAGIAYAQGPHLNAARFGDISYGVYITHFPIVNSFVALGLFATSPWIGFGASVIAVAVSSLLLWKFVERPFLKRSSHYRQVEQK